MCKVLKRACDICGASNEDDNVRQYHMLCIDDKSDKKYNAREMEVDLCEYCATQVTNMRYMGRSTDDDGLDYGIYRLGFDKAAIRMEMRQWLMEHMREYVSLEHDENGSPIIREKASDMATKMIEELKLR